MNELAAMVVSASGHAEAGVKKSGEPASYAGEPCIVHFQATFNVRGSDCVD